MIMFPSKALFSLLVLVALTVVDAGLVSRGADRLTFTLTKRISASGAYRVADKDRARARALGGGSQPEKPGMSLMDVTNDYLIYTAEIGAGSPPTNYTLVVDTGSSNTWVGAGKPYVKTSTSRDTGRHVSVTHGSGSFTGEEYTDTVTLSDLVISEQSIGVAKESSSFDGFDGIIGFGPIDLTNHTISGGGLVPTVMDNLFSQGKISEEVLGVLFAPSSESSSGEITLGGYDESATVSPVVYTPLTKTRLSSRFWGIDALISYGPDTILPMSAGIVDTGTTLVLIRSDAFKKYEASTGGVMDPDTGLLKITSSQYDNLQPLVFNIADTPFALTANAQIWPRSLNTVINGTSDGIYPIIGDLGSLLHSGSLDFVIGYTFLERYYSVFDTAQKRVGFAFTEYTFSECN